MATPALKASAYLAEMHDLTTPPSAGRLEWIVADLKRMLQTASVDPAPLHVALARAYQRLGRHEKALHHSRNAMHYAPKDPAHKIQASVSLVHLGRPAEALDLLSEVEDLHGFNQVVLLGNTAEALADLGLLAEAREVFEEALLVANQDDALSVLILAMQAAEIDADREAVELFARYLRLRRGGPRGDEHPLSVIQSASDEQMAVLDQSSTRRLKAAVKKALAFGHALFDASPASLYAAPKEELEAADADALAVYDDTLPLRSKATREAMDEGEHGR